MKLELMKDCLASWIQFQGLSVAQLTEMLGFKSKTSVFRLLQGKSNEQSIKNLYQMLSPQLDEEWQDRFKRALRVEKYGLKRYELFIAIQESIFEETAPATPSEVGWPKNDTILICGHPWDGFFPILDTLLSRNNQIIHYIMRNDAYLHPKLLSGLITHIPALNYQAILVDKYAVAPWNCAYTDSGKIYLNGKWLDTGEKGIVTGSKLEGVSLYNYEGLHRSAEYVDFVKSALELEKGVATVAMRPTPGLQMIPAEIEYRAFADYLSDNLEPISAFSSSLRIILEKRIRNFYNRKRPTTLILSKKAMDQFLREGTLTDQFFAMRPFTMEERVEILRTLERFSKKKDVQIAVYDRDVWKYSFEAYENRGVLVYSSKSNYNSDLTAYRELFMPGNEAFELFHDYIKIGFELRETITFKQYLESIGIRQ